MLVMAAVTVQAQDALETNNSYPTGYVVAGRPYSFCTIDGVLFSCVGSEPYMLVRFPAGDERTSYTIPNYVSRIARGAFQGCKNLRELTIPSTVIYIGDNAFDDSSIATFHVEGADDTAAKPQRTPRAQESARYDLAGRQLAAPAMGVNIVQMADGTAKKEMIE